MQKINPYLNFGGNCREALTFYQECIGGNLGFTTVGESTMAGQVADMSEESIIHAVLEKDGIEIMASDMAGPLELVQGNTMWIMIQCSSAGEIEEFYSSLSAGGDVLMPLGIQFWGDSYACFTDKFGIKWMLNYRPEAGA